MGAMIIVLVPVRQRHDPVQDLLRRLLPNQRAALVAVRLAQAGHQQPQVIVDLRDRGHRAARILIARTLVDADRRLEPFDQVDVGTLPLMKELAGVDRERLDVLALPLGKHRVQRQTALARTARAGDHHQTIARDVQVDVLQVVDAGSANANRVVGRQAN